MSGRPPKCLLDPETRSVSGRFGAYNLYIDPSLDRCGMTKQGGARVWTPCADWNATHDTGWPGCREEREPGIYENVGGCRLKRDPWSGDSGCCGDEVIDCLLDLMYARVPYTVMQRAVHIHPTVWELIPTMLGELRPL